jgi:rhamnogalacturonan endolyase
MGRYYYYTTYADNDGNFEFDNVRSADYALQAWASGHAIRDVTTVLRINDVKVTNKETTALGDITWKTQNRERIFQVGNMDRRSTGFKYGGAAHEHGLVTKCPANLTFSFHTNSTDDWCFGQSALGTWTIEFDIRTLPKNASAVLSVSLAGYSSGVSSSIIVNDLYTVGNLTSGSIATDPCMYRSGTLAGEWHYYEFPISTGILKTGLNTVGFKVTRTTLWHGFMWDSVMLEYA